jgi:hypothetical protein
MDHMFPFPGLFLSIMIILMPKFNLIRRAQSALSNFFGPHGSETEYGSTAYKLEVCMGHHFRISPGLASI